MDERLATARLTIDLGPLVRNWKRLAGFAPGAAVGAAVKADGYGLGLAQVTTALSNAGCVHFFTANAGEAVELRRNAPDAEIFVLGGLTQRNAPFYREANLTPVLNCTDDIAVWAEHCRATGLRRPCALHVDTGMNRLGLSMEEAIGFAGDEKRRHSISPSLVMSHLACADRPKAQMNALQKALFDQVRENFPGIRASLANSAAILSDPGFAYDIVRPGIALYGGEAVEDTVGPMENVAALEARILQIRVAKKGETVGYGASVTLERKTRIAICGIGYGDGLMRAASGSGVPLRRLLPGAQGHVAGRDVPVLGRISMDLTAFDVTDVQEAELAKCEWIELFGDNIALDDFARAAGTIGYEVLTAMGQRAARVWRSPADG